eukprot:CAMPEP_0175124972 /NCGR_PEP_ID=MMETSP0087-20121206/3067_1 /TAXON_ID=136419 /ORGANISM="Unknown Unknown, Strain D1" /LENGTH=225 /DNA_ID=CAMNT_0016406777 /DNA_START=53 /DNA_END=730 /DNA_ORIENTATION=-
MHQLAPSNKEMRCSACEIVVREFYDQLTAWENDHLLQVGGRNERGGRKTVGFARSETRILEIMDRLCADAPRQSTYVQIKATNKWEFRYCNPDMPEQEKALQQDPLIARVITFGGLTDDKFRRLCTDLVDDYEEAMVSFMFNNYAKLTFTDLRNKICFKMAKHCDMAKKKRLSGTSSPPISSSEGKRNEATSAPLPRVSSSTSSTATERASKNSLTEQPPERAEL